MRCLAGLAVVLVAALASACASDAGPDLGCDRAAALTSNGLDMNGLALNGLALNGVNLNGVNLNGVNLNGVNLNGVNLNGVNLNGMSLNGVYFNGDELTCNPAASLETFMEYTVGCALAPDQSVTITIDGRPHTYGGSMGLAPEWADGGCGDDCQQWVSACLIARSNARGEHVEISMRGDTPGLALVPGEAESFPVEEATYYGNLFADQQVISACLADGNPELDRVCGDLGDCPVDLAGPCSAVCDDAGCSDGSGLRFGPRITVFRDAL